MIPVTAMNFIQRQSKRLHRAPAFTTTLDVLRVQSGACQLTEMFGTVG